MFRLPTFIVEDDYLNKLNINNDEATKKCVVCMENFELKEILKTLPCCNKYFFNLLNLLIYSSYLSF
jgi:hypothetical protein